MDQQKLRDMITQPKTTFMAGALRREGNVFFIDGELPAKSSLEALFDSHCQSPAELFCISFRNVSDFHCGEDLARLVKKKFQRSPARTIPVSPFLAPDGKGLRGRDRYHRHTTGCI
ncbi:hypothetical protein [Geotalea toluenoxydans]|uniref:hypothetical protein n=1 Tax=Geotalea toluenoxydans TaxID=421624 RepID=UPI001FB280E6|nr:hypothetical protein [Geotalea toluenoxydans]